MLACGSSAVRVVDCRRIMLKSVKYLDHWSISVCENLILSPFPIHSYSSIYLLTPKALSPPIFVCQPYPLQNYVILTACSIFSIERNALSRRIRATNIGMALAPSPLYETRAYYTCNTKYGDQTKSHAEVRRVYKFLKNRLIWVLRYEYANADVIGRLGSENLLQWACHLSHPSLSFASVFVVAFLGGLLSVLLPPVGVALGLPGLLPALVVYLSTNPCGARPCYPTHRPAET